MFSFLKRIFGTQQQRLLAKYKSIVQDINRFEESYQKLSDDELRAKTIEFKNRYQAGETLDDLLPEAYAVVKNVCRRLSGQEFHVSGYSQRWDMIPYDVQMMGAIALHKGNIIEMQTGEGKTLTAAMPLYLNALSGKPVHIVTANDYLASRDCQWVGAVQRWLGLTTGVLTPEESNEDRKHIYKSDIVYGTASEFGFDYLRDNSIASHKDEQVQRGFSFALIDEVDSILIDEARTPLIISGPSNTSRQMYDLLKDPVDRLVILQKELCNRLALDAKKILEPHFRAGDEVDAKPTAHRFNEAEKEALRKLWLVSKGTPRNKVLKRLREDADIRSEIDKWDLYYYGEQNKDEKAKALSELYIIVEERASEYELTDRGIHAWQECGGNTDDFVMLDLSHEFLLIDQNKTTTNDEKMQRKLELQEEDALRKERAHNLRQLLRAHLLMEKDVEYIVQDQKVIIIDENTGRPQPGRRFSDGLHQAIEAKEHAPIQRETQTFATITLQNYFRMYKKLAGMTGTAITEAQELKEIYKLNVIQIPTYKPCGRKDAHDEMYMTEREKYNAILKEVREVHATGRPILLGTESVEVSEKLSRIFKLNRLDHTILNAKHNAREAEVIAGAGQKGAITLSTNMAGRGTDIKLGPDVALLGGLHVVGTTRHQSRRIDRQLRGRSGRLGDPGSSKFFISLEDPLMRLFSSPSLTALLLRFRPPEGEPISAPILNKSIETAQKRIEQRNYMIRKHTLEYDDVMNKQRQEIYNFRHGLLHAEKPIETAYDVFNELLHNAVMRYLGREKQPEALREFLAQYIPVTFEEGFFEDTNLSQEQLVARALERLQEGLQEKLKAAKQKTTTLTKDPVFNFDDVIENAIRNMMVRTIDHYWQEHLLHMDHLRADVNLRVVGQKDPLMEFKHEAFELFMRFTEELRLQIAQALFRFEIVPRPAVEIDELMDELNLETDRSLVSELEQAPSEEMPSQETADTTQPVMVGPKVGRNDPCPCGSGKKYKKCHGKTSDETEE